MPSAVIPSGLPLTSWHKAAPGPGHAKPIMAQSHVVTAVAPRYLGCDHTQANHVRIKSVQVPAPVELPAAVVPRALAIAVATLPPISPALLNFSSPPDSEVQLPMPEPSSAIMFLFAVFVAWGARRLDLRGWKRPSIFALNLAPPCKRRHRHRSKSIACYHAFQHLAP